MIRIVSFKLLVIELTACTLWNFVICFQNPREADAMTKIQSDLDETKIILVINKLIHICVAVRMENDSN